MDNYCRLCGAPGLAKCFEIVRSPKNIQKLLKSEDILKDYPAITSHKMRN